MVHRASADSLTQSLMTRNIAPQMHERDLKRVLIKNHSHDQAVRFLSRMYHGKFQASLLYKQDSGPIC